MANLKVSEMTEATIFDDDDYTMIIQSNQSKKISKENMLGDIEDDISTNATNISTINTNIGDLTNLTTPNTNNIVDAINSVVENTQNIITVGLKNEFVHTSGGSIKIPLDIQMEKIGNKLNFSSVDNAVVIGAGVNYVEVSAHILQKTSNSNLCGLLISKNEINLNSAIAVGFSYINTTDNMVSNCLMPFLAEVSEGDKIYLMGYSDSASKTVTYTPYNGRSNYLTVKVIS